MDDPTVKDKYPCITDLPESEHNPGKGALSAGAVFILPMITDDGLKGSVLDELSRIERRFPILTNEIMNGNDVEVSQLGQHLGFNMKPCRTGGRVPVDHGDR